MIEVIFVPKFVILSKFDSLKYEQKLATAINKPALTCVHMILQKFQCISHMAPHPCETSQKSFIHSCRMHPAPY